MPAVLGIYEIKFKVYNTMSEYVELFTITVSSKPNKAPIANLAIPD